MLLYFSFLSPGVSDGEAGVELDKCNEDVDQSIINNNSVMILNQFSNSCLQRLLKT